MSLDLLLLAVVVSPGIVFLILALLWLLGIELSERWTARLTCTIGLFAAMGCVWLGWKLIATRVPISWTGSTWFRAGEYEFNLDLIADRLSVPLMTLSAVLTGLVGAFSRKYLHRDAGYQRFYLLLNLFRDEGGR